MGWGSVSDSYCNIARSLSIVGDRWTLLIMREISLGVRRFEEIQAQTGMSSHLLAMRLKRLEQDKIVERRVYNARPLRHEYFATPQGKDLDAVVLALRNWDLRWGGSDGKGAPAVVLTDKRTGKLVDGTWHNPSGETFNFANCVSLMSDEWKAEREANVAAYYAAKKGSIAKRAKTVTSIRKTPLKAENSASLKKTAAKGPSVKAAARTQPLKKTPAKTAPRKASARK
jgi:DNA-binding HxlR family transcriptional regulator